MNNTLSLAVTALACSAGLRRLFSNLSLRLERGEALVVTGPNGAGKTTLLRTLAGLRQPDEGSIVLSGLQDGAPAALGMHYVGHRDGLRAALTIRENLVFAGSLMGPATPVEQAAERLAVMSLLDLPVGVLSAGQRRRVALARLVVSYRPLWLLDEPTAALDSTSHGIIEGLASEHLASGGMVVAATHLPLRIPSIRELAFKADGRFELRETSA